MTDREKRFVELGWQILEYKCVYYNPELVSKEWKKKLTIADDLYDSIEAEYRILAKELELPPTAADMVGFDKGRPACELVLKKIGTA